MTKTFTEFDAVVIGAGFGGLGAALRLGELGARVLLLEAVKYPGGCAATISKAGYRFDVGATLASGLAEEQLFGRWLRRYQLPVSVDWLDPVAEVRTPELQLAIKGGRAELLQAFLALPGAPKAALQRYFRLQGRVAGVLWGVLDRPDLLLPFSLRKIPAHLVRVPGYLRMLPWVGSTLEAVLQYHGLAEFRPLRHFLEALCQITVQCGVAEAEAPVAMAAAEYYFHGTGHVRGGIGGLAEGLALAVQATGGEVRFADAAHGLERRKGRWVVRTRKGEVVAPVVVANLLPHQVGELLPLSLEARAKLGRSRRRVETGWGAAMLYRVAHAPDGTLPAAKHLDLTLDPDAPLVEGNHVFASISGADDLERAPEGQRTITVSTHVPMDCYLGLEGEAQGEYIAGVQASMRRTLAALAPEWETLEYERPGSPRTFQRFTRRHHGFVGGVPRRAGLVGYRGMWPRARLPGLFLVGDSVFPGQGTLATALGGVKTAEVAIKGTRA